MTTYTVTTTSDVSDTADGVLTLREALALADAHGGADTIAFAEDLTGRTITLAQGQLEVGSDIAIDGGDLGMTVDAAGQSRVMALGALTGYTAVTLESLTISGGKSGEGGTTSFGGGVYANPLTTLTLIDTIVTANSAYARGGGIYAAGELTLSGSVVTGNHVTGAGGSGGGIYARANVTIEQSTVSDNGFTGPAGQSMGGGIFTVGALSLTASTVSGNEASQLGGGIAGLAEVTLSNSTIAHNRAAGESSGEGGGVFGDAAVKIYDSTFTGNYAGSTGGGVAANGDLVLASSILVGNYVKALGVYDAGVDVFTPTGAVTSDGHNVFGSLVHGSALGDITAVGADGLFAAVTAPSPGFGVASGVLADNGGPTETVALLNAWSDVAIGQGASDGPATDQRGEPRPAPGETTFDAGAYELQSLPPSITGGARRESLKSSGEGEALFGLAGDDQLYGHAGRDRLEGGEGDDRLSGGRGGDLLLGGAGADRFVLRAAAHSRPDEPDRILDFSHAQHDRISLRALDGDSHRPGDQELTFIAGDAFSDVGQVRFEHRNGRVEVEVNLDRDAQPEMMLLVDGVEALHRSDFLL